MLPITTLGAMRPRLCEINSLPTWCYCFLGGGVYGNSYLRSSHKGPIDTCPLADQGGSASWRIRVACLQLCIPPADPTLCWNTLIPGLQASTILGQHTSQDLFCTLCRDVDHFQPHCALACLESSSTTPTSAQPTRVSCPYATLRRPESALNICI